MGAGASANKATGSSLSLPRQPDTPTASAAAPAGSGRLGEGGINFVHSAQSAASGSVTRSENTTNRGIGRLSPAGTTGLPSLSPSPADRGSMSSLRSDGAGGRNNGGLSPTLTPSQQNKLRHCLTSLESYLNISFIVESVLPHVQVVAYEESGEIVTQGMPAGGLFVIDDGVVEVFAQDSGSTVLHSLLPGEWLGELGTLFGVACSSTARPKQRYGRIYIHE